jgi:hypothetical protein
MVWIIFNCFAQDATRLNMATGNWLQWADYAFREVEAGTSICENISSREKHRNGRMNVRRSKKFSRAEGMI